MSTVERSFSDLLRHPTAVTQELDRADVVLRRRGEPDLRLSRADREAERGDALLAMARALRSIQLHDPAVLARAVTETFSWTEFLPETERAHFVDEFTRCAAGASELKVLGALGQLIREWRSTAAIWADPELAQALRTPLQAQGDAVPRPA
jgi:hypothetical protein